MKSKIKSSLRKKPSKYAEIDLDNDKERIDETIAPQSDSDDEEMAGDFSKYQASLRSVLRTGDSKRKLPSETRTEPAKVSSEFAFTKGSPVGKKLMSMESMLSSLKKSSKEKNFEQVKKKLKDTPNKKKEIKTLEVPEEKIVTKKVARTVLYDNAKKEVSKWNSIVYHNRVADQLVFPLNAGKKLPRATAKDALADFVPRNPLEEEMAKILHGEEYVKQKKEEMQPKDTATLAAENYSLSVEEALAQHSEMARLRALQSYEMAKAKRKNKIKSKQYHRLLRREKIKKQLKEFEELQQKDPEAAMEKLNELEVSRIKERMSLKHRNTSKWAKMQAARAKYNKESRLALTEQLKISRDLTQKIEESSDDEEDVDLTLPSLVKSSLDNPWMLNNAAKDNDKVQMYFTGYRKLWEEVNARKEKERLRQEKEKQEEEERKQPKVIALIDTEVSEGGESKDKETAVIKKTVKAKKSKKKRKSQSAAPSKAVKTDNNSEPMTENNVEVLLDDAEEHLKASVAKKLKELKRQNKNDKKSNKRAQFKKKKFSTKGDIDEIQMLNVDEDSVNIELANEEVTNSHELNRNKPIENIEKLDKSDTQTKALPTSIDPRNFLKISKGVKFVKFDGSLINSADLDDDDEEGEEGEDEQRKLIAEAFEDDDVVAEFQKKKRDVIDKSMPKNIDLTLPGWGEWGGKNIKPSLGKRKRFEVKAKPPPPRKDARLSHVILNENATTKLKDHQVRQLPFPFTRVKDFEKLLRAPVGRTWMPEKSMKTLTAPKVITRLGAVIKPLSEDLLVSTKHSAKKFSVPESILKLTKSRKD